MAYVARAQGGSGDRYIFTLDVNGQTETPVVTMSGQNVRPMWTPDGSHLVFVNRQAPGESANLWAVEIRGGAAVGQPIRVQSSFPGLLIDVTPGGDLLYSVDVPDTTFTQFVAARRPDGTRIEQTFRGQSGTWSPSGRHLAYVRPRGQERDVIVRTVGAGDERTYRLAGLTAASPRWLPEDRGLIVVALEDTVEVFHRLDLGTGGFTRLFPRDAETSQRTGTGVISRDGRAIYLAVRASREQPWTGVEAVDLTTGQSTRVITFPGTGLTDVSAPAMALSPDGATLAIHTAVDGASNSSRLITVGIDGRDFRVIGGPYQGPARADRLKWTPDGRGILFVMDAPGQTISGAAMGWRLMRIPAAGGTAEYAGLDSTQLAGDVPLPALNGGNLIGGLDVSPDGDRIFFGARTRPLYELWSLDNVAAAIRR
jgi:Tol biopolymer transport system component